MENAIVNLRALEDADEIRHCFESLYETLTGSNEYPTSLSEPFDSPRAGIKCRIGPWKTSNETPDYAFFLYRNSSASPLLEINYYRQNPTKHIGGRYLKDDDGNYYIGHSRRVNVNNTGCRIPVEFLVRVLGGTVKEIHWANSSSETIFVLGQLGGPCLWDSILPYLDAVSDYKSDPLSGQDRVPPQSPVQPDFTPEVTERAGFYFPRTIIDAECIHGVVINKLWTIIKELGYQVTRDQQRDLYIFNDSGDMTVLFEAKTSSSTTDIYTGIGQLMFHGARQHNQPKRVLVLPGTPNKETRSRLDRLGIEVLEYVYDTMDITFTDAAIKKILAND